MSGSFQTSHHQVSTSARPYFSTECLHPLVDQLAPLVVVPRRMRPPGVDPVVGHAGLPVVLVRLRLRRQRLGHEADLHQRLHLALEVRIDDAIDDRPVVDRLPVRVLGVGVGGAPLQSGRAVAGRQQVVHPHVDGDRAELRQVGQQALPVLHVGVVGLVVAEPGPDRLHRPDLRGRVDLDRDRRRRGWGLRRDRRRQRHDSERRDRRQGAARLPPHHNRTSTGLPANVTARVSEAPATVTTIWRLSGASIFDPGASASRRRRDLSSHRVSMRMNCPLR